MLSGPLCTVTGSASCGGTREHVGQGRAHERLSLVGPCQTMFSPCETMSGGPCQTRYSPCETVSGGQGRAHITSPGEIVSGGIMSDNV